MPAPAESGLTRILYPDVPDNYRTRLDVQWPIYTGGRTDALVRAARAEAGAAVAETAVARADLRLEVSRAFWAVVTGRAAVTVLEQALVAGRGQRGRRARAPERGPGAAERGGVGRGAGGAPAHAARGGAQPARRGVGGSGAAGGRGPGQEVEPQAALEDAQPRPRPPATCWRPRRGSSAPSGRCIERRVDVASANRAAAEATRRPQVAVAGGVDYARPNPRIFPRADRWDDSWDAGVSVNWSLWDGGRAAADAAQATFQGEAARQRLLDFDAGLSVEVTQRSLEIASGQAAVAAADEAIRAATEARRVVGERYRAGVIAQSEVLDADLALLQVQLDRTARWRASAWPRRGSIAAIGR